MKAHVRVAVIGGGVVGCSVLYHLTKLGWSEVVLLERDELTSGSSWHAAGGMHTLNSDPNVAKLQDYTIRLYRELEDISGQSCGIHLSGGIMLAGTPERLDFLKSAHARGKVLGLDSEFISIAEAKRRHPLIEAGHFVGALFDPYEGHVDPAGVTHAYAKAARMAGAEIYRKTPVIELKPEADGGWRVITPAGTIKADAVVNAGGLWAREVGRLVGLELPVLAMAHHYLVTEDVPEVVAHDGELPHCIDFEAEIYLRQEGKGLLLGTYEKDCRPWAEHTTPADFSHELLEPDLDRIAPSLEVAFQHFPAVGRAGIKRVINGPFTFAPDGNPLVGPVPGLRDFYVACGVMAGFSQGGGVGLTLANWIVDGDPGMDVFAMDVARFGDFATRAYTNAKVRENYSRRFSITFPNEELPAARPLRTTPVYDRLKARGAVFGAAFGLEHALWFAPAGAPPHEVPTFRRSNAHEPVGRECRAVREGVGILEIANYGKHEVAGPGAEAWLDRLLAGRLPEQGRVALSPMLSPNGRLMGDLTVVPAGAGALHDRRLRRRRALSSALVRRASAEKRGRGAPDLDRAAGLCARRAQVARAARAGRQRGRLGRGPALLQHPPHGHRLHIGTGRARLVHRRARLRDLCRCRRRAGDVRRIGPGRRGPRSRALRRPRPELAPSGEELRRMAARIHAGLHARGRPASTASSISRKATSSGATRRCGSAMKSRPIVSSLWWLTPPTPMLTATSRCSPATGWSASSPRAAMATRLARASPLPMSSRPWSLPMPTSGS